MSARILQCTDAEYYADPCEVPSLSASIAKELIVCPSKAWMRHPRLGGMAFGQTRSMRAGSVLDELLTNSGKRIRVIESATPAKGDQIIPENYSLKDTQSQRDRIIADGLVPCLPHEFLAAKAMAETVERKAASLGSPLQGDRQLPITWTEIADDGTEVVCRCKMDFLDGFVVRDLKLTNNASPDGCRRTFKAFGYDLQGAAYLSALRSVLPECIGREHFELVFAEELPPYPVTVVRLTGSRLELGNLKWRRAVNTWARCIKTDAWPDYASGPITLDATPWEMDSEIESQYDKEDYDANI